VRATCVGHLHRASSPPVTRVSRVGARSSSARPPTQWVVEMRYETDVPGVLMLTE
jgi:hypothetical protein